MRAPISTYEDALSYVFGFHGPSPDRGAVARAYVAMRGETRARSVVHVTGTNGKGTAALTAEAALSAAEYHTVVSTSPHTCSLRERIRIDGCAIDKGMFCDLLRDMCPQLEALRDGPLQPSPMTVVDLMAITAWSSSADRVGVFEVGIGGVHDAASALPRSVVGLTRISGDHANRFGGYRGLVAEKLGLVAPGATLLMQPQPPAVLRLAANRCGEVGARLQIVPLPKDRGVPAWLSHDHALGLALARALSGRYLSAPAARLPGRFQWRTIGDKWLLLDGAHNAAALAALLDELVVMPEVERPRGAVVGLSRDRPWLPMLRQLLSRGGLEEIIVTEAQRPRGVPPAELARALEGAPLRVRSTPGLASALRAVVDGARSRWLITGSLLLTGDFDPALHALGLGEYALTSAEDCDPPQNWMRPLR